MAKTLCEWKKSEIVDRLDDLCALVRPPRFACRKCARVANNDRVLCKPVGLPTASGKDERE